MITSCRNIQVLEPDPQPPYDVTDNTENSLAVEEGGKLALTQGVTDYNVLFAVAKLSNTYEVIEADVSSADASPLSIVPSMPVPSRTVNGFALQLDTEPDSVNYIFSWRVKVTTL